MRVLTAIVVLCNLFIITVALLGKPISTVTIVTLALEAIVFSISNCHTFIVSQMYADDVNDIMVDLCDLSESSLTELNNLINNHMNKSDEDKNDAEH